MRYSWIIIRYWWIMRYSRIMNRLFMNHALFMKCVRWLAPAGHGQRVQRNNSGSRRRMSISEALVVSHWVVQCLVVHSVWCRRVVDGNVFGRRPVHSVSLLSLLFTTWFLPIFTTFYRFLPAHVTDWNCYIKNVVLFEENSILPLPESLESSEW